MLILAHRSVDASQGAMTGNNALRFVVRSQSLTNAFRSPDTLPNSSKSVKRAVCGESHPEPSREDKLDVLLGNWKPPQQRSSLKQHDHAPRQGSSHHRHDPCSGGLDGTTTGCRTSQRNGIEEGSSGAQGVGEGGISPVSDFGRKPDRIRADVQRDLTWRKRWQPKCCNQAALYADVCSHQYAAIRRGDATAQLMCTVAARPDRQRRRRAIQSST